jgi:hypothetical protein
MSTAGDTISVTLAMDAGSAALPGGTATVRSIDDDEDSVPSPATSTDALPVRDDTFFTHTLALDGKDSGRRRRRGGGMSTIQDADASGDGGGSLSLPLDGAESIQYSAQVLTGHEAPAKAPASVKQRVSLWAGGPSPHMVRPRARAWH